MHSSDFWSISGAPEGKRNMCSAHALAEQISARGWLGWQRAFQLQSQPQYL